MQIKLYAYMMRQDDPRKCTAAKLARFGFVEPLYAIRQIPRSALLLDPNAPPVFGRDASHLLNAGIVVIDCSWKKADEVFGKRLPGQHRRLPLLLAANPINYGQLSMLSSAEALAATLHIAGFADNARLLLNKFKWGPTFLTLNEQPLEEYRRCKSADEIQKAEQSYFPYAFKGY